MSVSESTTLPSKASSSTTPAAKCRFCGTSLYVTFVDLGMSPLCESFVPAERLNSLEPFFPLHAFVCENCFLVQLHEYVNPAEIFTEYAYFSSYSESWLDHARRYCAAMTERFGLTSNSQVVELASNDGYLLKNFVAAGIPALGVEPAANVAEVAVAAGVATRVAFFGTSLASQLLAEGLSADLLLGNNVLAQVPDINDFVEGIRILLKRGGVVTMEFPHLLRLMKENQFDTIYHEHFSYFSFISAEMIFAAHGMVLFDVEELPTHGGSLRIFGRHRNDASKPVTARIHALRATEQAEGLDQLSAYGRFHDQVIETKWKLVDFLIQAKRSRKSIVGYGAPGKGNTLLNFCGIRTDFLDYTVDKNPYKHGKFTPGTHIPIFPPDRIRQTRPDYVLILPWNFKDEIMEQMRDIRSWGAKFVVPIPTVQVLE